MESHMNGEGGDRKKVGENNRSGRNGKTGPPFCKERGGFVRIDCCCSVAWLFVTSET